MIYSRVAMVKDLGRLLDLELKCQEFPDTKETLTLYVTEKSRVALLASIQGRDVGYALCTLLKEEATNIKKLVVFVGVHPDYRRLGVSKVLMKDVSNKAFQESCHSIMFVVPNYRIDDPEDPDYLGWWFASMNLKAGRVWTDEYYRYGKNYDAYVFEALV